MIDAPPHTPGQIAWSPRLARPLEDLGAVWSLEIRLWRLRGTFAYEQVRAAGYERIVGQNDHALRDWLERHDPHGAVVGWRDGPVWHPETMVAVALMASTLGVLARLQSATTAWLDAADGVYRLGGSEALALYVTQTRLAGP